MHLRLISCYLSIILLVYNPEILICLKNFKNSTHHVANKYQTISLVQFTAEHEYLINHSIVKEFTL